MRFGGGNLDQALAVTLDAQGNLVIAGQTTSPDFPLRNPLFSPAGSARPIGFVARLDSSTGRILSSTRMGGDGTTSRQAVAADQTTAADSPGIRAAFCRTLSAGCIL